MRWLFAATMLLLSGLLFAEDKKLSQPKLLVSSQVTVPPGKAAKLILRGTQFDNVTGIKLEPALGQAKLLTKPKKALPPNTIPVDRLGDWEIEAEIEWPKDTKETEVAVVLTSPDGTTTPLKLRIVEVAKRVEEKEPNPGYATAQVIAWPCVVEGRIEKEKDVDVYRIDGSPGDVVRIFVESRSIGSAADLLVSVTDPRGRILETKFDPKNQMTKFVLPAGGWCCITVQEASDLGGVFFGYLLHVRKP